ncbi:MAG: hypothetical protein KDB07_06975, partial [Planctomycetes bacterium]|nr:hypothetical protein [Planctomycetota bacterium]
MSLRNKMLASFAVLIALIALVVWWYEGAVSESVQGIEDTRENYERVITTTLAKRAMAQDMQGLMLQARRNEKDFLLRFDLKYRDQNKGVVVDFEKYGADLQKLIDTAPEAGEAESLREILK